MGYRTIEINDNYRIVTEDEMPEWFNPREVVKGYYHKTQLHLCDIHWYDNDHDPLDIARAALDGYWWTEQLSAHFWQMLRAISAAGYGLLIYKDEATAKMYALDQ